MHSGVEIWRIESLVPQPIPKEDYGKFFDGDCYIVLHVRPDELRVRLGQN